MTPKEKAEELYSRMAIDGYTTAITVLGLPAELRQPANSYAQECALIAVDEILSTIQDLKCEDVNWDYWKEVKKEIQKL